MAELHETQNRPPQDYLTHALWTFRCPQKDYDIVLIPHTEKDRRRLLSEAKKGRTLVDYAQDEILGALMFGEISERS